MNGLLKEQCIEDIIQLNTFNIGQKDTEQGLSRPILFKMKAKVVTGSMKKMVTNHECDQCYNNYATKSSLYLYKQSKHEGVGYECDKCEYKAVCKSDITRHKQANLKGVKYECSVNTNLHESYKIKHEEVIYECDQGECKAV